jgi:hypothetical protein
LIEEKEGMRTCFLTKADSSALMGFGMTDAETAENPFRKARPVAIRSCPDFLSAASAVLSAFSAVKSVC